MYQEFVRNLSGVIMICQEFGSGPGNDLGNIAWVGGPGVEHWLRPQVFASLPARGHCVLVCVVL